MDKKNLILGIALICGAFASLYVGQKIAPQPPAPPAAVREAVAQQTAQGTTNSGAAQAPTITSGGPQASFASASGDNKSARLTTLENDFIKVRFTDFGGAVLDVALKHYPAAQDRPDPFVFNELHADPMLALTEFPGLDRGTAPAKHKAAHAPRPQRMVFCRVAGAGPALVGVVASIVYIFLA